MRKIAIRFLIGFLLPINSALASISQQDILNQLDNTQWSGKAGILHKGKLIGAKAIMTFKVHKGELYYLSSISKALDAKINDKAQGICVNSPPRKAQVTLSQDQQSYEGLVILPELVSQANGQTERKEYSIPIKALQVAGDKLHLVSIPLLNKGVDVEISYQLQRDHNDEELDQLSYKLHDCLENEVWKK